MLKNISTSSLQTKTIYLRLLEGNFLNVRTRKSYNTLSGSLIGIEQKEHHVENQTFTTWNMLFEDSARNERYSVSFGYESGAFRHIIDSISNNMSKADLKHLTIHVWSSNGFNNARVLSNGARLRWSDVAEVSREDLYRKVTRINQKISGNDDGEN